jgi:hypothetical protein
MPQRLFSPLSQGNPLLRYERAPAHSLPHSQTGVMLTPARTLCLLP